MEIWEFMKAYSDSFWAQGDFAFEIFEVLFAWCLTIGPCLLLALLLPGLIAWLVDYFINN